jgi:hypothetical protein
LEFDLALPALVLLVSLWKSKPSQRFAEIITGATLLFLLNQERLSPNGLGALFVCAGAGTLIYIGATREPRTLDWRRWALSFLLGLSVALGLILVLVTLRRFLS